MILFHKTKKIIFIAIPLTELEFLLDVANRWIPATCLFTLHFSCALIISSKYTLHDNIKNTSDVKKMKNIVHKLFLFRFKKIM